MLRARLTAVHAGGSRQVVRELVRDEGAGAGTADPGPFRGQLLEREQRRRTRDGEIVGQRSRRWESRAWLHDAVENGPPDLRVDLLLQRTAGAAIDADEKIGCSVNRHDSPQCSGYANW